MAAGTDNALLDGGRLLPLVEDFYTIQGEGYHAGKPAYFIRLGGCDVGCSWCDAKYTWNPKLYPPTDVGTVIDRATSCAARAIVITGGEPLLQPEFVAALFGQAHARPAGRVHTCLDTCGYAYTPDFPERFDALLRATDLVLLDIKHADPEGHRALTERSMDRILAFGDELARRNIKTVIRHVVVPGYTDSVEECEKLGRLIAPWHNVVGLEMLPYHTMGVVKYEQLGIPYKLEGVPQMDKGRIPELRAAVLRAMKGARASE